MAFHTNDLPQPADVDRWSRPRISPSPIDRAPRDTASGPAWAQQLGAAALDLLPDALVLVDAADGTILGTNGAADDLLASGDGLAREAGRLVAREGGPLERAIARLRSGERETDAVQLARPSGRPGYQVSLAALPGSAPGSASGRCPGRGIALFVHDPDRPRLPSAAWLASHYKLTRMESEVARDLAAGRSLQEIAKGRFISIQTVRGHLKQVFAKTGTHRQGELIARLLSGPPSIASAVR